MLLAERVIVLMGMDDMFRERARIAGIIGVFSGARTARIALGLNNNLGKHTGHYKAYRLDLSRRSN